MTSFVQIGFALKSLKICDRFFKINEAYFFFLNNKRDLKTPSISKTSFLYFFVTSYLIAFPTLKASPNSFFLGFIIKESVSP